MNSNLINEICDGDLEKLIKIPKTEFNIDFTKKLLNKMDDNLKDLNYIINNNLENNELKFISCYYYQKLNNIEKCKLYLKKIN